MTNLRLIVLGVVVIIGGIVAFSSLYTVHQTQQALILEFGQPRHEEPRPAFTRSCLGGRRPTMTSVS